MWDPCEQLPKQTQVRPHAEANIDSLSFDRRSNPAPLRRGAIVDGSAEAIVVMTPDGAIMSWNPAAEKLYGFTVLEAQGRSIAILHRSGEEDYLRDTDWL